METIRLVMVDDEINFLNPLAKRLKKRGMNPELAASARECLSILEKNRTDIVVSDVKMPGMDGLELLKEIKEKYPGTEVILLTGQASTTDGVEGIKRGAFDYLTKPIELEHLVSKIHQAFEKILRNKEKQREAEFRSKLERQMVDTERLASLGTLATGVAHEINNPLAIIKESAGYMGQILAKKELEDFSHLQQFTMAVKKIETGVERARKITHKLLGFVQRNESSFLEVDLKELAKEVFDLLYREAANKEITLVQEFPDDAPCMILSDPYQLRQVLLNLVANAIHASSPGGSVDVAIAPGKDEKVVLTVKDEGEGIPKENLKKIFEPFFSTKSPGKGTGLGLFVTHNILKKLGGSIEVESSPGRGAIFTVRLPVRYEAMGSLADAGREDWLEKIRSNL